MMDLSISSCPTPVGPIVFATRGGALVALGFAEQWPSLLRRVERRFGSVAATEVPAVEGITGPLAAYFAGDIAALEGLPVDLGGTAFQERVWAALRTVAPGSTSSYTGIAAAIGAPGAVRAVGAANGANPVSLVVPCHRVIGAEGDLRGYAGGLERKRWLLGHEAAHARSAASAAA
jgi:methylated-DNA-[protein]-cysteine S-methyltransferase